MNKHITFAAVLALSLVLILTTGLTRAQSALAPLDSTFTYQGRLTDGAGNPITDICDLRFRLYDDPSEGAQVGPDVHHLGLPVQQGLFHAPLAFGWGAFNGEARWLQVAVRCPAGAGPYTPLSPRQDLTPAPYALALPGLRTRPSLGTYNVIGGSLGNSVSDGVAGGVISGGGFGLPNRVTDHNCVVAGGGANRAGNDDADPTTAAHATVSGGMVNIAGANLTTVGGGEGNHALAQGATIGGGIGNLANGENAAIAGGQGNVASGDHAAVGGGGYNTAGGQSAIVGGGRGNTATGYAAVVSGGGGLFGGNPLPNVAAGRNATIGGGSNNTASAGWSTVGGGYHNETSGHAWQSADGIITHVDTGTVGGGSFNYASWSATVGGGTRNRAIGQGATVPGGSDNDAGSYSFAAGRRAKANAPGCFVWGDSTNDDIICSLGNQWLARTSGGAHFYTSADLSTGVYVPAGGGSWSSVSDRNLKEHIKTVDSREVLALLQSVPVTTWNYRTQDASIRHMGPMAQDFYAAFGLGDDDVSIATVDLDGVALAAIQGLADIAREQDAEIDALQGQLLALEARLAAFESGDAPVPSCRDLPPGLLPGAVFLILGAVWVVGRRGVSR